MATIFGVLGEQRDKIENLSVFNKDEITGKVYGRAEYRGVLLERNVSDKFMEDKCLLEDEEILLLLEGVILNLSELMEKYDVWSCFELLKVLYNSKGEDFFSVLRGNFCGCLFDKREEKGIIFTDHLGNQPLYYCISKTKVFFSSSIKKVKDYCQSEVDISLNLAGAYSLVTYAYMYDNLTLCNNIYRLRPGCYLVCDSTGVKEKEYYHLNFEQKEISMEEAIDNLDKLFLRAVALQVQKNKENGYYNFAPLSAGLDSRITTYALNRLEAENVVNFTYSESGELDQEIPMKIARELKNKWLFKSLDWGWDLLDIEKSIKLGDSKVYYAWISQLEDFMSMVSKDNMGIIHTGVIGDVVIGTFWKCIKDFQDNKEYKLGYGAYSKKLISRLDELGVRNSFPNYEEGMYYNRALNGACLGYSIVFQKYTECMSPFMNIDFLNFCLSLPIEYRSQHNIYYKWVRKYYPEAAKYSHNGLKITSGNGYIKMNGKRIYLDTIPSRILLKMRNSSASGMNPMEYWYRNNIKLKNKMDTYFQENVECLKREPILYQDVMNLYNTGTAIEKNMCISLAGYVSLLWGKDKYAEGFERL
ncbi:MAG: hypothetical protein HFH85_01120 [Lachnospiraceae bacterium]|jgi:asparagine synthase (glutamine-hydrolysing)|nr:hypothetical protein [Lachnospiraceae bacterium]